MATHPPPYDDKFVDEVAESFPSLRKTGPEIYEDARRVFDSAGGPRQRFLSLYGLPTNTRVHHAIELDVLQKFPGLFTADELNDLTNFRGIPIEINDTVHLSEIRNRWTGFYNSVRDGLVPRTRQSFIDFAADIDRTFGHLFTPPA